MNLTFRHNNLDNSSAEWNRHKIELIKDQELLWRIWVDGKLTNGGAFQTRVQAICKVEETINLIDPSRNLLVTIFCSGCKKEVPYTSFMKRCAQCGTFFKRPSKPQAINGVRPKPAYPTRPRISNPVG